MIGSRLGHYEILEKLGQGGMGEVWRASDTTLGRDVALKVLPAAFAADPERMARFEREAKVLAALNHPGIAAIYGFHEAEGVRFLAMELVEGEDLSERLARGALPVDEALAVGRGIAEALEYAHEQGIVHRDLKPANVKVALGGSVKVLDFGLAKAIAGDPSSRETSSTPTILPTVTSAGTAAGIILGTAAYMSPEQARGRPVDKRSDVWAFGCVLFECLTGRKLFEGDTVSDLIAKILQTDPDWSALPSGTPPRVRELLGRCLERDARERLRDIGEARIVLASPGAASPASESRRGGVPWWAAAAGALTLTAVAVVVTLQFRPSAVPAPLRKLDLAASDVDVDWSHAPVISPDGSRIAYLSKNRLWVRDLAEIAPRAVADVGSATPIGWSPDSRALVYADGKTLWRIPADGGRPTAICEIPGTGTILGATWSRTDRIAFAVWRGALLAVPAAGGPSRVMVDLDPATTVDFHAPSWLPNGDLLYATHWITPTDASGKARSPFTVFDGERQIDVEGDLGDGDALATPTSTGEILFLREGPNSGLWSVRFDVERRRLEGAPVPLAPDAVSASVSAEGSLLYVEGASEGELREMAWVDRSGTGIEGFGAPHAGIRDATLSPDGRRVAFVASDGGNADVWVRDLVRETETRLTFGGADEEEPAWLASSSRLAFVRLNRENLAGRIVAVDADGSGVETEIAPSTGMGMASGVFGVGPDGRWAIRIVDDRGRGRLRIGPVLPDGRIGDLKPLLSLDPEPDVQDARISPDGRLLAYVTNEPGQTVELFVTRFPSGVGRWQVGTEGGRIPRWAKESGELFYSAGIGPSERAMVAVKVDASLDPPLGAATRLFGLRGDVDLSDSGDFDVTADGRRFLFLRPSGRASASSRRMVLVQNWRQGLPKDRAP